jgi:hypothetical protein
VETALDSERLVTPTEPVAAAQDDAAQLAARLEALEAKNREVMAALSWALWRLNGGPQSMTVANFDRKMKQRRETAAIHEWRTTKLAAYLRMRHNPFYAQRIDQAARAWIEQGQWILDDE